MGFSYDKYKEIVSCVNYLSEKLKEKDESDYKSLKVEEIACQLISIGNSLNAYIRHSKKARR